MSTILRILLLEDTVEDAELAVTVLDEAGYSCQWERVETRDDFLARLASTEYDLILSDYRLPAFDGISAARLFADLDLDIPFILVSGTLGEEAAVESLKAGASDFVLKNKLFRLPSVVERALKEKAEHRRVKQAEAENARLAAQVANEKQRLTSIIASVPGVVWEAWGTPDGAGQRIDFVSDYVETMLGYTVEEWESTPNFWLSIVHPDDKESTGAAAAAAFAAGTGRVSEFRWITKDGVEIWVEAHSVVILDENGKPSGLRGVTIDITERKRAAERIRQSESQLAEAQRQAHIGSWSWDLESDSLTWSDEHYHIFGLAPGEITPDFDVINSRYIHEEDRDEVKRVVDHSLATSQPFNFDYRVVHPNGSVHVIHTRGNVESDEYGDPIRMYGTAQDVTQPRRADTERKAVTDIIKGIVTTSNLDDFLELVHHSIGQVVYSENCFVMLYSPETGMNHFEFWSDKNDPLPEPRPPGKGFSSYVLRTGEPLLLTDELKEKMCERGDVEPIGTTSPSWVGVPLRTPMGTIGALVLQHYEDQNVFSEHDVEFLLSVGDQVALAIERKRAEHALARSEESYRLLFEKNPLPMWVYDLGTLRFLEVNPAAVLHYGYSRDEFLSMTIRDIRPPDTIPALMKSLEDRSALQSAQTWQHKKKDGTVIDVELTSHSFDFSGSAARLVLSKDVTETKRVEEALSESEERNRDLVENALDIIYTHDLEGNYLSVNQVGERITGYTKDEVLRMNFADSIAPEHVELAERMIAQKLAGHETTAYELDFIAKDGKRVTVEVNTRIIYEDEVPVRVQGIARDVTERKQLEEQFRQAQKMESIGVLAGGIAHDFNNLLTAINGYGDLTLMKMQSDDPLRRNIEEITRAGARASELTSQLLAFSRKQVMKPIVHNLNTVISNIQNMLRRIIKEDIELRTVLAPDLANIKADPGQIEQVIMNLAVNARDAMPGGGSLTIQTQNVYLDESYVSQYLSIKAGPFVKMTVTDTGCGMDEAVKEHMFEPFYTTKEVSKGTGLGLSTVYGIVKQSGGDIMVYSEVGHGTVFKIYFPGVDEIVQKKKWPGDDDANGYSGTETILLVEDEDLVRSLVREILTGNGYKVLEASSGKEALEICAVYPDTIHMLITDVIMPKMGGSELRDHVVSIFPDIKVLFMSGYTDDSVALQGVLESDVEYIEKPFTPDSLSKKVREALSQ